MSDYPKRLILGYLPNNRCNLKCNYCYISQLDQWEMSDGEFRFSAEYIAQCLTVDRLGGVCLVNLTAQGETLLYKDIVRLVKGILEQGHYIELVTNATVSKRVEEILGLPDELLSRLEFKISYHYEELLARGLFNAFARTVKMIQESPASFTLELMPYDAICGKIEEIIDTTESAFGAKCHVTVGRNDSLKSRGLLTAMDQDEYVSKWGRFESAMFDLKMELLGVKRREFCYAGDWTLWVDFSTGEARQCYGHPSNQNIFKDPSKPIKFYAVGTHCVQPYCINGHAFLSLGAIPELDTPTYFDTRNRVMYNGSNWLKASCAEFFSKKLVESNEEYSKYEKVKNSLLFPIRYILWSIRSFSETRQKISTRLRKR